MSGLKAVILVGGLGTRLRPLTNDRPKSVLPVLNRPFMEYTFAYLKQFGIEDIILTINYLPDVIQSYFNNGERYGVELTYCYEKEPMGTAGAIKNAGKFLDGTFVVLNGDIFTDLNLKDMLELHRSKGAMTTISLQWVDDPSAFGVVETDDDRKVLRFIEKPPRAEATTNWINAGVYILEPEVLKWVPENTHFMVERGLFPALLDMGKPVYGYQFRDYWVDVGTPETYFNLNCDLIGGKAETRLQNSACSDDIYFAPGIDTHPSVNIKGPAMIGNGSRIGEGVILTGPVIIGNGCSVHDGAVIGNSILWDNINIGAYASINHCIIGSDVAVYRGRKIKDYIITSSAIAPLQSVVN